MPHLRAEASKSVVTHNVFSSKVLKLGAIGARVTRQGHEVKGSLEGAIMVGGDIRNEVRGSSGSHEACADLEITHDPRVY